MKITFVTKAFLALGIATCLMGNHSFAALTFDLRAATITHNGGGAVPVGDAKNVNVEALDLITLELYAQVTGVGGGTEGYQTMLTGGVVATANGPIGGAFESPSIATAFNGTSAAPGTLQDLNADSRIDLGSNNTSFVQGQHVTAAANAMVIGNSTGVSEFKLFTVSYRVASSPVPTSSIALSFRMINVGGLGNELVWSEDGVTKSLKDPNTGFSTSGYTVTLTAVPEPSAFGMVLVGALGLVGFRRLGFRRS